MDPQDAVAILRNNRFIRSSAEATAFEAVLESLPADPDESLLREMYLVLDDSCEQPEVMFSLIHLLESYPLRRQLSALAKAAPQLTLHGSQWLKTSLYRVLNDDAALASLAEVLDTIGSPARAVLEKVLAEIGTEARFAHRAEMVLARKGA